VLRNIHTIMLGAFVLVSSALIEATENSTPPCTCGSNVRVYLDTRVTGVRTPATPEPTWCAKEGRALLNAAYDETPKIPPGFRGNAGTDFDEIMAVYWVEHPSPPRIVGSCRMSSTLSAAAALGVARQALQDFLEDGTSKGVVYPYLRGTTIVKQQEQRLFFEFQLPSERPPHTVAFRIWKSSFLMPTTGWLLPDADRTGTMSVGTVSKHVAADDISLFLEQLWWESSGTNVSSKALGVSRTSDTSAELLVKMPVLSIHGGDMPDEVLRDQWSVRVNRRTGEIAREIEPDILCRGRESRSPQIVN
jgi:hypothetical protein